MSEEANNGEASNGEASNDASSNDVSSNDVSSNDVSNNDVSNNDVSNNDVSNNGNVVQALPAHARRLHLLGVGGTGMGTLACMLKQRGFEISGSDTALYPPMSEVLEKARIPLYTPYAADNLKAAKPDVVVVGNVIRRENPEAAAVRALGLPQMSMPALLWDLFLRHKHVVCIAGTHGKTTTTLWFAHMLQAAGLKPSWLAGGVGVADGKGYGLGEGPHFVIEGDEYDTAYFDKGPKFFHYRPKTLVLTSVEYDHADIYADMQAYESVFRRLSQAMPEDGFMAVSARYPNAVQIARAAPCAMQTYAARPPTGTPPQGVEGTPPVGGHTPPALLSTPPYSGADYTAGALRFGPMGTTFEARRGGQALGEFVIPLSGYQNIENALAIVAAGQSLGLSVGALQGGLGSFAGVLRRQELRVVGGIVWVDDFAHHPTAVRETLEGLAARYPGCRLWALFEPRSNTSRRKLHQRDYAEAFGAATLIRLKTPAPHDKISAEEALDVRQLVADLCAKGKDAQAMEKVEALVEMLVAQARPGDVVVCMSNGSFDGLYAKLLKSFGGK